MERHQSKLQIQNGLDQQEVNSQTSELSQSQRDTLIRENLRLEYDLPKDFTIEVVSSVEEMEAAFRILHDAYVDAGYMKPHPTGMRILPQHLLLTTTVVVAKLGQEVIGTVSMIRDSALGLPWIGFSI